MAQQVRVVRSVRALVLAESLHGTAQGKADQRQTLARWTSMALKNKQLGDPFKEMLSARLRVAAMTDDLKEALSKPAVPRLACPRIVRRILCGGNARLQIRASPHRPKSPALTSLGETIEIRRTGDSGGDAASLG